MFTAQRGCVVEDIHYPGGEIAIANPIFYGHNVAACVAACKGQATCVIGYYNEGLCYLKNKPIKANLDFTRTGVYTGFKYCVAGEQAGDQPFRKISEFSK